MTHTMASARVTVELSFPDKPEEVKVLGKPAATLSSPLRLFTRLLSDTNAYLPASGLLCLQILSGGCCCGLGATELIQFINSRLVTG